jgi:hypothetical protein
VAYGVHFKPSAADAIRKLPKSQQRRVIAKAEALAETPRPAGCRKLLGEDELEGRSSQGGLLDGVVMSGGSADVCTRIPTGAPGFT